MLTEWDRELFWLMGRLKSGVTVAEARASLGVLTTALATEYPAEMGDSELWVEQERRARPSPDTTLYLGLTSPSVGSSALSRFSPSQE